MRNFITGVDNYLGWWTIPQFSVRNVGLLPHGYKIVNPKAISLVLYKKNIRAA
jgi:hypothetical protein